MKKEIGIIILLVLLCVVMSFVTPNFASAENVYNLLKRVGISGIFSIGLGIVIITGGIDLSVGSVFALQGVALCMMLDHGNRSRGLAVAGAMAGVVLLGCIHGLLITRVKLQPFLVTLCGLMIYRGLARSLTNDVPQTLNPYTKVIDYGWLRRITTGEVDIGSLRIPAAFIILTIVGVIMWVVLHWSVFGRYLYAVGRNEEAAKYSGVRTRLVIGSAYVICMVLTGISGIIWTFENNGASGADTGVAEELNGIAAAVLGGCSLRGGEGSILGIVLGCAVLRVLLNSIILLGILDTWNLVVSGVVILLGVMLDQLIKSHKRVIVVK